MAFHHAVDDSGVHDECHSVCDDYAKLQYVDIKITDCDKSGMKVLSALNDSGAQISVIRSDVLGNLHVPYVGKVKLRGIVGSPVSADLVKLYVALSNSENMMSTLLYCVLSVLRQMMIWCWLVMLLIVCLVGRLKQTLLISHMMMSMMIMLNVMMMYRMLLMITPQLSKMLITVGLM